jgi:hypothetical protein
MPREEMQQPGRGNELDDWLARWKSRYDNQVDANSRSSMWFAINRDGLQFGTAPPLPQEHRFIYRGFRDYFHGQGRDLANENGPAPHPITGPIRTGVYKRKVHESDEFWSVAFSVPVWAAEDGQGEPIGVLGMNLDLKGHTRVEGDRERFAVLVDTRPDSTGRRGLIVRHPHLEHAKDDGSQGLVTLHYADAIVRWADSGKPEFPEEHEYEDPVGGEFAGPWLAAVERVVVRLDGSPVDTGWVVLIQERREDVLQPVEALKRRLAYGAAAAFAFILVLVALMWVGMMAVLNTSSKSRVTQLLRRWAGLPAAAGGPRSFGSMGSAGTFSSGSGSGSGSSGSGTADEPKSASPR